jgi:transglutaminase-like putative cysteine protease
MKLDLPKINLKKVELLQSITLLIVTVLFSEFISMSFIAVILLLALWSLAIALEQVKKPSVLAGNILAVLTATALFLEIGIHDTVNLFVAMLLLSTALKQLVSNELLHFKAVCLIQLFLISSVYLYQQSLYTSILAFCFFIGSFATLHLLIRPEVLLTTAVKLSAKTLILSLPLAFILFLLLPRLPSFWSLPGPNIAKTGLNENIDPFSISKLAKSSELVFRVNFTDEAPALPYYWRSMVHEEFTSQAWRITNYARATEEKQIIKKIDAVQYEVIAQKSSLHWLYGLDYAQSNTEFVNNKYAGVLSRSKNLSQTFKYTASSNAFKNNLKLNKYERNINLKLPQNSNPKAVEIAKMLKYKSSDDKSFYNNLLNYYITNQFSYTLEPPSLVGENKLDQFLINSKRGFCGHYASLSAFIFRSAGIPARVVSGYLGGEISPNNQYLSVYQYDAHAWTEVWLKDKGWTRFDATSVVSPDRLNGSLSQSQQNSEEFMRNLDFGLLSLQQFPMLNWIRLNINNIDYMWTNWVLGFDSQAQKGLLEEIFGKNITLKLTLAILGSISLFLFGFYCFVLWQKRPQFLKPLEKEYHQVQCWGEKNNAPLKIGMTPQTYFKYLIAHFNNKAPFLEQLLALYIQVRYKQSECSVKQQKQAKHLIKMITK